MDGIVMNEKIDYLETDKGKISLPCLNVRLVPIEKVKANTYNPNHVSEQNMRLLEESVVSNGFCFPVVTIYDSDVDEYVIIDGFHRYYLLQSLGAKVLPIVVLDHDITKRMAATIQFNRARGVHQVELMGDLVKALVEQGVSDEDIAVKLGMEEGEVYRLKQITGIAELFKNQAYSRSWEMQEVSE
jgi:ParB-like chromosome segregation protein Spo0J